MEQRPNSPPPKGPAEWFSGDVWIDPVTQGEPPSRLNIGAVHFGSGARTAWHSHGGGQTLYVTEGRGLVRSRGGQTIEIRAADVFYTPSGEEHWHGATAQHFMTHPSITEAPRIGAPKPPTTSEPETVQENLAIVVKLGNEEQGTTDAF
jgi:quercetin dioxygenase-like cupin family protein